MPCYVYRRWRTWHVHHEGRDSGYGLQQQGRASEEKVRTAPQNSLTSGSDPYFGWHLFGILVILFSHCLYDWPFLTDNNKYLYISDIRLILRLSANSMYQLTACTTNRNLCKKIK